jgi:hypothetical protein
MPRVYRDPEYRRRVREKTEQDRRQTNEERKEADYKYDREQIILSIKSIEQELNRGHDENHPQRKRRQLWNNAGVVGLWLAAVTAIWAILAAKCSADKQYNAMMGQQWVMQGQLDEMRNEQRPWVTLASQPEITTDFIFGRAGINMGVLFAFRNTGRYPALNVLPGNYTIPSFLMTKGVEFERACNQGRPSFGIYVFPGDNPPPMQPVSIGVQLPSLREYWDKFPSFGRHLIVSPIIFVCIVYQESGSGKPHHTPFSYDLRQKNVKSGRGNELFFLDEGYTVPKENLVLRPRILGGPPPD